MQASLAVGYSTNAKSNTLCGIDNLLQNIRVIVHYLGFSPSAAVFPLSETNTPIGPASYVHAATTEFFI